MNTIAHFILSYFMFASCLLLLDAIANTLNKRYKIRKRLIFIIPTAAFCSAVYTGCYLIAKLLFE